MIQNYTASEILRHALDQCACYGAPSDMMATLRGALAFVDKAADIEAATDKQAIHFIPAAPVEGVVQDE